MAFIARVTRSSMLEVMREDYIRTARSKGLAEYLVIFRHAVKNAFLPVVTVSGYQFARTIGGTVVIETIFLVPGIGNFLVISVLHRDFNAIQATFLIIAVFVVVVNLFVDLLYGWLNPRVRYA
jgi:ABC-type dipeptide/oligopeptide/nickel transport system permease component